MRRNIVADIIGVLSGIDIYPSVLPQGTAYPAVTMKVIGIEPQNMLARSANGFRRRKYEFSSHSTNRLEARTQMKNIENTLSAWDDGTLSIFSEEIRSSTSGIDDDFNNLVYSITQSFTITYRDYDMPIGRLANITGTATVTTHYNNDFTYAPVGSMYLSGIGSVQFGFRSLGIGQLAVTGVASVKQGFVYLATGSLTLNGVADLARPDSVAYNAWLNRCIALGATPPTTTKNAVQTFYTSFFNNGFQLSDFDFLYLTIGENGSDTSTNKYNQKRVNLMNPGTFDATIYNANSSGHQSNGTQGDGSMYWDTGFNSSTRLVNRGATATLGCVETATDDNTHGYNSVMGVDDSWKLGLRDFYSNMNYGGAIAGSITTETAPAMYYIECVSGTGTPYRNASSNGSCSGTGTGIGSHSMYCYGQYNGTNTFAITYATLTVFWHGKALNTGSDRSNWYTIIQTLMSALGVTI